MLSSLRDILEMIRFSHTLFALPFALLAAVMAWATPTPDGRQLPFRWQHLLGIILCMITARSAAMAFNRIIDRNIDAQNPRTQNRHLPSGKLSVASVAFFTAASALAFVLATLLFLPNYWPIVLSTPVLLVLFIYSYTKRFTSLAHFWLGASLMLAPIAAWIAIRGQLLTQEPSDLLPAIVLGIGVLLWVAGFDIIYACQDIEFDTAARLRSVPAALGVEAALRVAGICHLAMLLVLFALPWICPQVPLGWFYLVGIAAVAILLIYEHSLVRADDLTRVNMAFFHVNSVVSLGLFLVGSIDLLLI